MVDEKFVEGIGDIVHSGMVVRFDLLALDPSSRDSDGKMKPVLRQRVVMPIDAFVSAVGKLSKSLPELEKMGVLQRRSVGKADKAGSVAAVNGSDQPTPAQTNTPGIPDAPGRRTASEPKEVGTFAATNRFDQRAAPEPSKTKPLSTAIGADRLCASGFVLAETNLIVRVYVVHHDGRRATHAQ